MEKIQFDYFRGMEADQYSFYRVPKILFTAECFRPLSCEAKVLYGLLLDRMSLSIRNRWFDEEGRVYIIFTVDDVMELLNCGRQKAVKNLAELDSRSGIGLIEKKRLGLGKPNVIYVKNFIVREIEDPEKKEPEMETGKDRERPDEKKKQDRKASGKMKKGQEEYGKEQERVPERPVNPQKYENQTSGSMKNGFQEVPESYFRKFQNQNSGSMIFTTPEVPKSQSNDTDINDTDYRNTENNETELSRTDGSGRIQSHLSYPYGAGSGIRRIDEMDRCRRLIRQNIGYGAFQGHRFDRQEEVDELVELMVEVLLTPDECVLRIAGTDKPAAVVKSRFLQIGYEHIEYALECLRKNTTKVGNIKAYLLTVLYNSTLTIGNYYQAEVNHDMYGG